MIQNRHVFRIGLATALTGIICVSWASSVRAWDTAGGNFNSGFGVIDQGGGNSGWTSSGSGASGNGESKLYIMSAPQTATFRETVASREYTVYGSTQSEAASLIAFVQDAFNKLPESCRPDKSIAIEIKDNGGHSSYSDNRITFDKNIILNTNWDYGANAKFEDVIFAAGCYAWDNTLSSEEKDRFRELDYVKNRVSYALENGESVDMREIFGNVFSGFFLRSPTSEWTIKGESLTETLSFICSSSALKHQEEDNTKTYLFGQYDDKLAVYDVPLERYDYYGGKTIMLPNADSFRGSYNYPD